jgi:hypothetical protein
MIYKTIHIKLKIEQHEPHQHRQCCGEVSNTNPTNTGSAAGKVGSYCSTINVKGKSFKGKVRKIMSLPRSTAGVGGVRVAQFLVLCVLFYRS